MSPFSHQLPVRLSQHRVLTDRIGVVLEDWRHGAVTSFKSETSMHFVEYINGHGEWVLLGEGDEAQEARPFISGGASLPGEAAAEARASRQAEDGGAAAGAKHAKVAVHRTTTGVGRMPADEYLGKQVEIFWATEDSGARGSSSSSSSSSSSTDSSSRGVSSDAARHKDDDDLDVIAGVTRRRSRGPGGTRGRWYCGKVVQYREDTKEHLLLYEDGDRCWYDLASAADSEYVRLVSVRRAVPEVEADPLSLVGEHIEVLWSRSETNGATIEEWRAGYITDFTPLTHKHFVEYPNGEAEWTCILPRDGPHRTGEDGEEGETGKVEENGGKEGAGAEGKTRSKVRVADKGRGAAGKAGGAGAGGAGGGQGGTAGDGTLQEVRFRVNQGLMGEGGMNLLSHHKAGIGLLSMPPVSIKHNTAGSEKGRPETPARGTQELRVRLRMFIERERVEEDMIAMMHQRKLPALKRKIKEARKVGVQLSVVRGCEEAAVRLKAIAMIVGTTIEIRPKLGDVVQRASAPDDGYGADDGKGGEGGGAAQAFARGEGAVGVKSSANDWLAADLSWATTSPSTRTRVRPAQLACPPRQGPQGQHREEQPEQTM